MSTIGRRGFVASLGLGAGAYLLDPIARRLVAEARGQASAKRRFVTFGFGCGFEVKDYEHDTGGAPERAFGPDFPLRPAFAPLDPYRQDLLILERFFVPPAIIGDALHGAGVATFTLRKTVTPGTRVPGGATIDRFIAKAIGGNDPFSSINLGYSHNTGSFVAVENNRSADGPATSYPAETDPKKAFAALFGVAGAAPAGVAPVDPQKAFAGQKSVLDLVRADVARLQGRLAGPERAKLDQYLTSLRELEGRLSKLATPGPAVMGASCNRPADPALGMYPSGNLLVPEAVDAFLDVVFTAIACGRTHVATYWQGMGAFGIRYANVGDMYDLHSNYHQSRRDIIAATNVYLMGLLAKFYARLKTVPEGNGTLADSTLIMSINDAGGSHHNGWDRHSVVLLGRLGGALRTGRYMKFPMMQYSLGPVFTSIANLMGAETAGFGDGTTGPLPGLT